MSDASDISNPSVAGSSPERILPVREVIELTTLSRSTIYREVEDGRFPAPIQISKNRIGWPESRIRDWLRDRAGTARPQPPSRRCGK